MEASSYSDFSSLAHVKRVIAILKRVCTQAPFKLHAFTRQKKQHVAPGGNLWRGMRVGATTYLLQGPPITENKSPRIERIERHRHA
jgi:hypothetical protein